MTVQKHYDIDRGWAWVVAIAAYLVIIINSITLYMGGVLYIALLDRFHEGKAKTSLVGALSSGLLCFLSPLCGVLINKCTCRLAIVSGGIITTIGFAASAYINSLDAIIVMAGCFVGIGFALTIAGVVVVLGYYFQKRRNLMISTVFVFVGVGMFMSSPLGLLILDKYGLSSTFLIIAGLNAQICICGMLCKPSSFEKEAHTQRQKHRRELEKSSKRNSSYLQSTSKGNSSYFNLSLIFNKAFFCILLSTGTWNFALTAALMHLPNYMKINGETDSGIGLIMTTFSIANTVGRVSGTICISIDRIDALIVHIVTVGLAGIITGTFPLYSHSMVGKYIFTVLLGILCGCPNSMFTTLSIRFVGVSLLPEANGLSYLFCGIGVSTGPVVTGYLFGLTGSYKYSFVLAGAVLLLGCIFGIASSVFLRFRKDVIHCDDNLAHIQEEKLLTEVIKETEEHVSAVQLKS